MLIAVDVLMASVMELIDCTMTEAISTSTAISTQTYAAGLIGQRVTVAVTEKNSNGQETAVDVKYGDVESVNFIGGSPVFRLKGDDKDYSLSYLLGMGEIPNPYDKGDDKGEEESKSADAVNNSKSGNAVYNGKNDWLAGGLDFI